MRNAGWAVMIFVAAAVAASNGRSEEFSTDITVDLGGIVAADEDVVEDSDEGAPLRVDLGPLPTTAEVGAYETLPEGAALFTFETTTELSGGVFARPHDVVRWSGSDYAIELRGGDHGVPPAARIDAVAQDGADLLLSFDVTVDLGDVVAGDEDLVRLERAGGSTVWSLVFDGSEAGLSDGADLDGADRKASGVLVLSFDVSGALGGLVFHDEDLLDFDAETGAWSLRLEGESRFPALAAADVDAVAVPEPGGVAGLLLGAVALGWARRRGVRR